MVDLGRLGGTMTVQSWEKWEDRLRDADAVNRLLRIRPPGAGEDVNPDAESYPPGNMYLTS